MIYLSETNEKCINCGSGFPNSIQRELVFTREISNGTERIGIALCSGCSVTLFNMLEDDMEEDEF